MEDDDFLEEDGNARENWTDDYFDDLDTSQYPFPNTLWNVKPAPEVAFKTSLMLLVGLFGLFCNFVILLIIARNRWLWSATNYLIANMAMADFLTLALCPWLMLVRDFYQNYELGEFGCRFEGFLQATLLLGSVGAVMLVSYDRLAAAALTAEARVTKVAAPRLIIGNWIVAICLSLPWTIKRDYRERIWLDYIEKYCVEDKRVMGIYWHMMLTLLVWVPLGLMVLTYGVIMWRLERSVRELTSRGGGRVIAKAKGRALRITACVLLTASICRIPYTALIYWRNNLPMEINSVEGKYAKMWFAANYLMYLNCALNPLIYGFSNARFRKAMDRTIPVAWCRFGSWCCVCPSIHKHRIHLQAEEKNTERVFVIETSPRPNNHLKKAIHNILHINRETLDLSFKNDELTAKPTKVTPLKTENV